MFPHETGRNPAGRDNLQAVAARGADAARLRAILVFAAVVEFGTGLALIAAPTVVVRLLLGAELGDTGVLVGRCLGIALVALALACWPAGQHGISSAGPLRGILAYNLLLALFLAYLGTVAQLGGLLLWPAAELHAAVALWLVWAWP
jgi:hypothetical protein